MGNWVARKWYGDDIDDLDKPPKGPEVIAEEEGKAVNEAARKIGSKLGKIMKPVLEAQEKREKQRMMDRRDPEIFEGLTDRDIDAASIVNPVDEDEIDSSLLIASDNDDEEDEEI